MVLKGLTFFVTACPFLRLDPELHPTPSNQALWSLKLIKCEGLFSGKRIQDYNTQLDIRFWKEPRQVMDPENQPSFAPTEKREGGVL